MPLAVAIGIIVALLLFMLVAVARERGPGAPDVAIGYERAWDELNFGLLWDLSGEELRDGLRRDQFIAAKQAAYANAEPHGRLADTHRGRHVRGGQPDGARRHAGLGGGHERAQRRVARAARERLDRGGLLAAAHVGVVVAAPARAPRACARSRVCC